jgi:AAA15 family ATPase/GTPase
MQTSLIEFSVENFKIFKEKVTFSMLARKSEHTFERNGEHLLKTSLIFGPNASGKTTLLDAFDLLKQGILFSATQPVENSAVPYLPFLFSHESESKPVFFEVIFSLDNEVYKYSFSLLNEKVISENLFEVLLGGSEKKCFSRLNDVFEFGSGFEKDDDIATKTRKESLFLSAAAQWNNTLALKINHFFLNHVNVIYSIESRDYGAVTAKKIQEDINTKEKVLNFLQKADFCINDIEIKEKKISSQGKIGIKSEMSRFTAFFMHKVYDKQGQHVGVEKLNISDESQGTKHFLEVLGPLVDTLEHGKILWIDEFDNSLHPKLTKFIVDLFESKEHNPLNSQLIVTTHDTSLLSYKDDFVKDQFWFTEKDAMGAGKLFSLAEFTEIRHDTEFSKKYLEGRFGALPMIDLTK